MLESSGDPRVLSVILRWRGKCGYASEVDPPTPVGPRTDSLVVSDLGFLRSRAHKLYCHCRADYYATVDSVFRKPHVLPVSRLQSVHRSHTALSSPGPDAKPRASGHFSQRPIPYQQQLRGSSSELLMPLSFVSGLRSLTIRSYNHVTGCELDRCSVWTGGAGQEKLAHVRDSSAEGLRGVDARHRGRPMA